MKSSEQNKCSAVGFDMQDAPLKHLADAGRFREQPPSEVFNTNSGTSGSLLVHLSAIKVGAESSANFKKVKIYIYLWMEILIAYN